MSHSARSWPAHAAGHRLRRWAVTAEQQAAILRAGSARIALEYAISALDFMTGLPSLGTYSAYPLPGRTFMAKAGLTF